MMNKAIKKIGAVLCCVIMAAGLSGCMRIGVGVELKSNGKASLSAMYAMSADYCTEDDFADEGYEVKTYNIGGKDYIGYEYTEDYDSFAELSSQLTSLSEDGMSLFTFAKAAKNSGLFTTVYTFDAVMPALMGDSGDYGELASSMIAVDFTLKMPGVVKYCEGGTIGDDGSITFTVDPSTECTFSCESRELNFVNIFLVIAVLIVVIGVIASASKKKDI